MEFIQVITKLANLPQDANDYVINLNLFASASDVPMLLRPMTDASKEEVNHALHMAGKCESILKLTQSDLFTAIWYPKTRKEDEETEVEFVLDHLRTIKQMQLASLDKVDIRNETILNGIAQHIYQNYAYFNRFPHYTLADIELFRSEEQQTTFLTFQWNVQHFILPPSLLDNTATITTDYA